MIIGAGSVHGCSERLHLPSRLGKTLFFNNLQIGHTSKKGAISSEPFFKRRRDLVRTDYLALDKAAEYHILRTV